MTDHSTDPTDDADEPAADDVVDGVLSVLDTLEDLPLSEHVAAFESVHAGLQRRLADGEG